MVAHWFSRTTLVLTNVNIPLKQALTLTNHLIFYGTHIFFFLFISVNLPLEHKKDVPTIKFPSQYSISLNSESRTSGKNGFNLLISRAHVLKVKKNSAEKCNKNERNKMVQ